MTLKKMDLVKKVANETGLAKKEVIPVIDNLLELIKEELSNGNHVQISGFGKFKVAHKSARTGRNPKTGEAILIEARKVVTFRASQTLRDKG